MQMGRRRKPFDSLSPVESTYRVASAFAPALLLAIASVSSPAFGQARAQVAFVRETNGNSQLWVMNEDGSDPRQLTTSPADKHSPSWCPGNRVLRFQTIYGDSALYELSSGREQIELPSFSVGPVGIDGKTIPPDRMAFRASRRKTRGQGIRCGGERDGAEVRELRVPQGMPPGKVIVQPSAVAPDRDFGLALRIVDLGDRGALSTLGSGRAARLNRVLGGGRLAYVVQRDRASEIWSVDAAGGTPERIARISGAVRNLTCSPDGSALLFDSDHDGIRQIYRWNWNDGALEPLTRGAVASESPAWSFKGQ
jgi:Tol biopolymer transport system component